MKGVIVRVAIPAELADVLGPFVVHRQWGSGVDWVVTHNPTGRNISKGATFTRMGAVSYARALLKLRSARWWRQVGAAKSRTTLEPIAAEMLAAIRKHALPGAP